MSIRSLLHNKLQPGDLVLSGRRDFVSEITQFATGSRFGHAMIVVGPGELVQATDFALTPQETDEGVFTMPIKKFLDEIGLFSDIRVMRPKTVDMELLRETADFLLEHSPAYPSVGAVVLGFWCAGSKVVAGLPTAARKRVLEFQFRLAADGPTRMHCAELVFRLYHATGLRIELTSPILGQIIDHSRTIRPELLEMRLERRRAARGQWPARRSAAVGHVVKEVVGTLRSRFDSTIERDHAGLVMPGDFEDSPTFTPVLDISRRRIHWQVNLAA